MWLRIPKSRKDLGGIHSLYGVDLHATTAMLTDKNGKCVLNPQEKGFLIAAQSGMLHTTQRMARGRLLVDCNPICPSCNGGEETAEHIFCTCPAFARHRQLLWQIITPLQLFPRCPSVRGLAVL